MNNRRDLHHIELSLRPAELTTFSRTRLTGLDRSHSELLRRRPSAQSLTMCSKGRAHVVGARLREDDSARHGTPSGAGPLPHPRRLDYLPRSERASHYFHAQLPHQFDVILHFDETRAVQPLERNATWEAGEVFRDLPFNAVIKTRKHAER